MSKRAVGATPSPSKRRKANAPVLQGGTLDSFFRRSPNKFGSSPKPNTPPTVIDLSGEDDEALAVRVAKEEGLDLETARRLEQRWKSEAGAASTSSAPPASIDNSEGDAFLQGSVEEHIPGGASEAAILSNTGTGVCEHQDGFGTRSVTNDRLQSSSKQVLSNPFEKGSLSSSQTPSFPELSEDPLLFNVEKKLWPSNAGAPYSFLAHSLNSLSSTRSRILILNILTNTLRSLIQHDHGSLVHALYLLSNTLSPPYISAELGLGPSIISRAIQHVSGLSPAALKKLYNKSGDAGDVAFEAKSKVRTLIPHPPLSVKGVYESLMKISVSKGEGAMKIKQSIVEKLLVSAKGEETRYLVRTLVQHIRVGAVRTTILTALARALVLTRPSTQISSLSDDSPCFASRELVASVSMKDSVKKDKKAMNDPAREKILQKFITAESIVKKVYVQHPNYNDIVEAILTSGLERLSECVQIKVGVPLHPTLGSPTRSLDEIYERLGEQAFSAEFKYDGQRAQIHAENVDGRLTVKIFSRHLEDMTDKYPDIVSLVGEMYKNDSKLSSFVMDAEIVAIDPADGSLRTFQELSNRARKDVQLTDVKVCVCVFAFDLMYHNGVILLEEPFRFRRRTLRERFPPLIPGQSVARFAHVESCESGDGKEAVEEFWQRAVESRSEGLMVKLLDSGEIVDDPDNGKSKPRRKPLPATYEPDKRTMAWLKLKKDYVLGLGDSLDLVPIGAWHGNGRKAAWWSPILLALWDENAGQLIGVCKCMSGFRDEFYIALNERYPEGSETCSKSPLWNVNTGGLRPEVYFKPQEVWEIRGADITLSPVSVAALGLVSDSRGLSLRFPRFIRVRDDKGNNIEQASSPEFLANMWKSQQAKGKDTKGNDDGELVDKLEESEEEEDEYEE
ncbi:ATP-dependent DNA ligase [Schizopora paradoxa]|uniref:DNA ligase n=1 Tax=Schizopora paradoxa TaxID=27342 RepID=A0A0H2SCD5_9AGAM|nr:ATP-dependent DNA ligase [Schizopora paradoxa]